MSINPDNELLKHMLDETTFILNHTENLTREDLSLVGLALPHAVRKDRPVEKKEVNITHSTHHASLSEFLHTTSRQSIIWEVIIK